MEVMDNEPLPPPNEPTTILSPRDTKLFLEMLADPSPPNEKLMEAARRYRENTTPNTEG